MKDTAILLIHCPDSRGIIAAVTQFIGENNGNIITLDQYVDPDENSYFSRIEWELDGFQLSEFQFRNEFEKLAVQYNMKWNIHFSRYRQRMAIFVSKMSHCLYDILQRYKSKEWNVEIPLIISNHHNLEYIAQRFDIPYYVFQITPENKAEQEAKELELLKKHQIDFVVLARYMQVLTEDFINEYPSKIINIHHSSLPAFAGAKPYHQAYKRGVKLVGATSHFVTQDLDAGPIIAQNVEQITHKDTVKDIIRKGKNMEKIVLSQGIWLKLHHKILPYKNRTIVFQ